MPLQQTGPPIIRSSSVEDLTAATRGRAGMRDPRRNPLEILLNAMQAGNFVGPPEPQYPPVPQYMAVQAQAPPQTPPAAEFVGPYAGDSASVTASAPPLPLRRFSPNADAPAGAGWAVRAAMPQMAMPEPLVAKPNIGALFDIGTHAVLDSVQEGPMVPRAAVQEAAQQPDVNIPMPEVGGDGWYYTTPGVGINSPGTGEGLPQLTGMDPQEALENNFAVWDRIAAEIGEAPFNQGATRDWDAAMAREATEKEKLGELGMPTLSAIRGARLGAQMGANLVQAANYGNQYSGPWRPLFNALDRLTGSAIQAKYEQMEANMLEARGGAEAEWLAKAQNLQDFAELEANFGGFLDKEAAQRRFQALAQKQAENSAAWRTRLEFNLNQFTTNQAQAFRVTEMRLQTLDRMTIEKYGRLHQMLEGTDKKPPVIENRQLSSMTGARSPASASRMSRREEEREGRAPPRASDIRAAVAAEFSTTNIDPTAMNPEYLYHGLEVLGMDLGMAGGVIPAPEVAATIQEFKGRARAHSRGVNFDEASDTAKSGYMSALESWHGDRMAALYEQQFRASADAGDTEGAAAIFNQFGEAMGGPSVIATVTPGEVQAFADSKYYLDMREAFMDFPALHPEGSVLPPDLKLSEMEYRATVGAQLQAAASVAGAGIAVTPAGDHVSGADEAILAPTHLKRDGSNDWYVNIRRRKFTEADTTAAAKNQGYVNVMQAHIEDIRDLFNLVDFNGRAEFKSPEDEEMFHAMLRQLVTVPNRTVTLPTGEVANGKYNPNMDPILTYWGVKNKTTDDGISSLVYREDILRAMREVYPDINFESSAPAGSMPLPGAGGAGPPSGSTLPPAPTTDYDAIPGPSGDWQRSLDVMRLLGDYLDQQPALAEVSHRIGTRFLEVATARDNPELFQQRIEPWAGDLAAITVNAKLYFTNFWQSFGGRPWESLSPAEREAWEHGYLASALYNFINKLGPFSEDGP